MKVVKYKKGKNGKYSVYLDDGRELSLYEDIILKYELLLKKDIDNKMIDSIYQANLEYDVYFVALKSVSRRNKSCFELTTELEKKEYPQEFISSAIKKLSDQGYLDDRGFARSYINNQIITTGHGPLKIKNDLLNKKIDSNVIDEEMAVFSDDLVREKINKKIRTLIKSNRNKGGNVLKQKIINSLKLDGFLYSSIMDEIDNYTFKNDNDLAKKEYLKLYKKYSSKYSGYELETFIRNKLCQKGLVYEEE